MSSLSAQQVFELATQYHGEGRLADAESLFRQILAHLPDQPRVLTQLGRVLLEQGRTEQAIAAHQRALQLHPGDAAALNYLGQALARHGDVPAAIQSFRQAISLHPDDNNGFHNLAMLLFWQDRLDEAIRWFEQALVVKPDHAIGHYNLGVAHMEQNRLDWAIAAFQRAAALDPRFANATWNLSWALLKKGRFPEGWRAYESRWHMREWRALRRFSRPLWDGGELAGRRILLHAEQGLGDAIQMVRFVPMVAARGGRVILDCQPQLQPLFVGLPGVQRVIATGQALPPFEVHCPLMSLPGRFDITLDSIPAKVPYLSADPEKVEYWRQKLAGETARQKVGLVWAGRAYPPGRSIDPTMLAPLLAVPNVRFYSLQTPTDESAAPSQVSDPRLVNYGADLRDFSDTAALVMNLDLLISIDTAAAHLAGALGRPAWLLLRHAPDWRWMLERADSPWYPTMKLFRQRQRNDWSAPIRQIVRELSGT